MVFMPVEIFPVTARLLSVYLVSPSIHLVKPFFLHCLPCIEQVPEGDSPGLALFPLVHCILVSC